MTRAARPPGAAFILHGLRYDEFEHGVSWMPRETMRRTSHALATDDGVWLVDPVDVPEALERVAALGPPAGVIQLLDRHNRDCASIAARLGVPHLRLPDSVPGSPFTVVPVLSVPRWHEKALWWPERRVLVVAELIGTTPLHRFGDARAGLHPLMRLRPPRALRAYRPEHLLVGHGAGIHGPAATEALDVAYARALRDLPALGLRLPRMLLKR